MSDDYPDSLPYEVLDNIAHTISGKNPNTTWAAAAANAMDEARRKGYLLVKVPDGMTVEDAQQALTEARPWALLPYGPTKEHIGKRVRQQWTDVHNECLSRREGVLTDVDEIRSSAAIGGKGDLVVGNGTLWFIHPDDVPADPDAELIEAMAKAGLNDTGGNWDGLIEQYKNQRRQEARAALAVVREHEATR